ncbi:MAG: SagB/ThcOx family dehydrogenase [Haloarculaceae archaeon]
MVDAREYHERTNHSPERLRRQSFELDWSNQPRPYKVYENRPRVAPEADPSPPETPMLEAVRPASPDPPDAAPAPDGDPHLPTLCHYAAGVTKRLERGNEEVAYRAAACTGKLYHVDLYAVAGDCGAFDPAVYHFDPDSGGFDVLREGDYRGVLATAAGDYPAVAEAPVTFVATSEWWRNAWKYRERTYRHAFWDSGTVLANLLAVAHGSGHRAEVVAGFADDPVVETLGLDPDEEAPLALVPVGRDAPPRAADDAPSVGDPAELALIDPAVVRDSDPVDYPLVPDAWRQSRLAEGTVREWRERFAAESADASLGARRPDDWVELDPVDSETASARPVGATVERRGSLREYSHEPVSARKFATILDRALGGVPADCFGSSPLAGLVDVYCLVHAVEGVERGVYEYHPGACALERVGDTDRETAGDLALGQSVVGDAAVNVYLVADVDAVVERFGNRGYRVAQLEAGLDLGRLYLATYAHLGLGGRGFTFFDERVAEHLGTHGQVPMTLFAFGRPGESVRSSS